MNVETNTTARAAAASMPQSAVPLTSYLEANPDEAECIAHYRKTGQFVPIVRDGTILVFLNRHSLDAMLPTAPLPVEDYVVGLEVMGFTFQLWTPTEGAAESVFFGEPPETLPESWDRQALRIMEAFGTGRRTEVAAFLKARLKLYDGPGWYALRCADGVLIQWAQPCPRLTLEGSIDLSDAPGQRVRFTFSAETFEELCEGTCQLETLPDGRAA